MPFIACKPVRFDRDYMIGELVPDEVVVPSRVGDLEAMKLIARVPVSSVAQVEPESADEKEAESGEKPPTVPFAGETVTAKKAKGKGA